MPSQNSQASGRPKWGVGSFFQQAVAGVESKLDTILAEEEAAPNKAASIKGETEQPGQHSGMYMDGQSMEATKLTRLRLRPVTELVGCSVERPSPGAFSSCCCQAKCRGKHWRLCVDNRNSLPDDESPHSCRQWTNECR